MAAESSACAARAASTLLDSADDSAQHHPEATPGIADDDVKSVAISRDEAANVTSGATTDGTPARHPGDGCEGLEETVKCYSDTFCSEAETVPGVVLTGQGRCAATHSVSMEPVAVPRAERRQLLGCTGGVGMTMAARSSDTSADFMQSLDLPIFAGDTAASLASHAAFSMSSNMAVDDADANVAVDDSSSLVPIDVSPPRSVSSDTAPSPELAVEVLAVRTGTPSTAKLRQVSLSSPMSPATTVPAEPTSPQAHAVEIIETQDSICGIDVSNVLGAEETPQLFPDEWTPEALENGTSSAVGTGHRVPNRQQGRRYRIRGKQRCGEEDCTTPRLPVQKQRVRRCPRRKRRRGEAEAEAEEGEGIRDDDLHDVGIGATLGDEARVRTQSVNVGVDFPGMEHDTTVFGVPTQPSNEDLGNGPDAFTNEFKKRVNFFRHRQILKRC